MPFLKHPSQLLAAAGKLFFTVLMVWLIMLCCTGCYSVRQMERQVTRGHNTYPGPFAQLVHGWYPPITISDSTTIEYLPGKMVSTPFFLRIDCDSAVAAARASGVRAIIQQPCPPATSRVDTFRKTTVRVVQDSLAMAAKNATIHDLQDSLSANQARLVKTATEKEAAQKGRRFWRTWGISFAIAFVVLVAFGIWRTLSKFPSLIPGKRPTR